MTTRIYQQRMVRCCTTTRIVFKRFMLQLNDHYMWYRLCYIAIAWSLSTLRYILAWYTCKCKPWASVCVCVCVCLDVCPSHASIASKPVNRSSYFWRSGFPPLTVHCDIRKAGYSVCCWFQNFHLKINYGPSIKMSTHDRLEFITPWCRTRLAWHTIYCESVCSC